MKYELGSEMENLPDTLVIGKMCNNNRLHHYDTGHTAIPPRNVISLNLVRKPIIVTMQRYGEC